MMSNPTDALQTTIRQKIETHELQSMSYQVQFFRLQNETDLLNFNTLLQNPSLSISDKIESQLKELIKSYHPTQRLSESLMQEKIAAHIGTISQAAYGVWVYYPWLHKIVHILDKEEFIHLRTNRNQYKISPAEKEKLSETKIGVLGLSVGQSVALALSMERSYGELRIADFDTLDLSNLNRIRSGLQDLGLLKTVSTARQIAEIDPFIQVTCFHEGVHEGNIDDFLHQGGKLNILIDECDGFDVKILARLKAREAQIPVLMETSDRCMLDIERFDLEPNRPILHGLIEHMDQDFQKLKGLSMEQKFAYILPILGINTMSDRIKASMLEVEQTITTWPQLASDVIMGGAVTANVCRRISLGKLNSSGRFFLDLDELVNTGNEFAFPAATLSSPELQEERNFELQIPKEEIITGKLNLQQEQMKTLVEAAVLAPSGGNSQPWKFIYQHQNLFLQLDKSRARSFLDFKSAGSIVAIGAAAENIAIQAASMQIKADIQVLALQKDAKTLASIHFNPLENERENTYAELAKTIPNRLTYRKITERKTVPQEQLSRIKMAGESIPNHQVLFIEDEILLQRTGKILSQIDKILITNPLGHEGFMNEIRWSDEEAKKTGDGIDIATVNLSAGEVAGFMMAKKWSVIALLKEWKGGSAFEKMAKNSVNGASAMGLITLQNTDVASLFELGRSLQRLWLTANQLGIAFQPMSPITFLIMRMIEGNGEGLSIENITEIKEIHTELNAIFKLKEGEQAGFLFRLLQADGPVITSYRRPLEEVYQYKG